MSFHVSLLELNAWTDGAKLEVGVIDAGLEESNAVEVFGQLSSVFDSSTWLDETTTPQLIRKLLAMRYVGWYFLRTYSEDTDISNYGMLLLAQADALLQGLLTGSIILPEVPVPLSNEQATFYPTDASSAQRPNCYDSSLGGPAFSMGQIW